MVIKMDENLEKKDDVTEEVSTEDVKTEVEENIDMEQEKSEEKSDEKTIEVEKELITESSDEEKPKEEIVSENAPKKSSKFGFVKFLWKIIKTILIVVLALVLVVILVQRVSNNKATVGGYGIYTVVSESMVPEYNIWDMLFAKKIDPAEIKVGDDVVYQGKEGDFTDRIVTHRVIKITRHGNDYNFVTKGIANPVEDPEITADQIYGKVVLKSVVLTEISKLINTTYGFYFIIFVPFVVIVTLEIIDTVNERKKLKNS